MFESDEPHFFTGDLTNSEELLTWLKQFVEMDAETAAEEESSGEDIEGEALES